MGPISRFVRRSLNPFSTGVTNRWYGGWRSVPDLQARQSIGTMPMSIGASGSSGPRAIRCVMSPGDWSVPAGERPGWSWLPEPGAFARIRSMPTWVRVWYMLPFIDRYAYSWMWWHGGWAVPACTVEPPLPSGVREPRRPRPPTLNGHESSPVE